MILLGVQRDVPRRGRVRKRTGYKNNMFCVPIALTKDDIVFQNF